MRKQMLEMKQNYDLSKLQDDQILDALVKANGDVDQAFAFLFQ